MEAVTAKKKNKNTELFHTLDYERTNELWTLNTSGVHEILCTFKYL